MTKILVLPDKQIKPNIDLDFLRCIGEFIVDKKPDIIVDIGDFSDMESLSSYDKGKKSFEGRRYKADIAAAKEGMSVMLKPMRDHNQKMREQKKALYHPEMHMFMGNHEDRINRAVNNDPMLDGTISTDDLEYKSFGWNVHPFLEVGVIEGIAFSHYFQTGVMGRPASSAQAQLNKKMMSCVAGHQQGRQSASAYRADGKRITSIIAGSCYQHDESYLGFQGNKHWRGLIMLHNVVDGEFDECWIPLHYLVSKYKKLG